MVGREQKIDAFARLALFLPLRQRLVEETAHRGIELGHLLADLRGVGAVAVADGVRALDVTHQQPQRVARLQLVGFVTDPRADAARAAVLHRRTPSRLAVSQRAAPGKVAAVEAVGIPCWPRSAPDGKTGWIPGSALLSRARRQLRAPSTVALPGSAARPGQASRYRTAVTEKHWSGLRPETAPPRDSSRACVLDATTVDAARQRPPRQRRSARDGGQPGAEPGRTSTASRPHALGREARAHDATPRTCPSWTAAPSAPNTSNKPSRARPGISPPASTSRRRARSATPATSPRARERTLPRASPGRFPTLASSTWKASFSTCAANRSRTATKRTLLLMTSGSPYLVTVKVLGREPVQVKAGKFPAIECSSEAGEGRQGRRTRTAQGFQERRRLDQRRRQPAGGQGAERGVRRLREPRTGEVTYP